MSGLCRYEMRLTETKHIQAPEIRHYKTGKNGWPVSTNKRLIYRKFSEYCLKLAALNINSKLVSPCRTHLKRRSKLIRAKMGL